MTPEEKVALLKEARVWDAIGFPGCIDKLIDLVAAHEREACAELFESAPNQEWSSELVAYQIRNMRHSHQSKG